MAYTTDTDRQSRAGTRARDRAREDRSTRALLDSYRMTRVTDVREDTLEA